MTTQLKKAVHRETETTVRDKGARRELVLSLLPGDLIGVRLKGTRTTYTIDSVAAYHFAVKIQVAYDKRMKAKAKKEKA